MHVRLCHLIKVEIKKKIVTEYALTVQPVHYQGAHWSVSSVSLSTQVSALVESSTGAGMSISYRACQTSRFSTILGHLCDLSRSKEKMYFQLAHLDKCAIFLIEKYWELYDLQELFILT